MTGRLEGSNDSGRVTVGSGRGGNQVSIRKAAALLGVHPNTVRHRVQSGVYRAEKIDTKHGPMWMIDRASLSSNTLATEPELLPARPHDEPGHGIGQSQSSEEHQSSVESRWRRWVFAPFRLLAWPFVTLYYWLGSETTSAKALVRISEIAALLAVLVAAGFWLQDIPQRQLESEYQAWQVVDAAAGAETSNARIIALELLNESQKSFEGLDLAGADMRGIMRGINLPGANLTEAHLSDANLSRADLPDADLSNAFLIDADLSDADLVIIILSDADLSGSDLSGANLTAANLIDADLTDADLTDANLSTANLSGANLSRAQGVTNEEIAKQTNLVVGATMPNGQKYEDWLKDRESREEDGEGE
jgi:uncharacterized protein YjbI with pentapeptide repeats